MSNNSLQLGAVISEILQSPAGIMPTLETNGHIVPVCHYCEGCGLIELPVPEMPHFFLIVDCPICLGEGV